MLPAYHENVTWPKTIEYYTTTKRLFFYLLWLKAVLDSIEVISYTPKNGSNVVLLLLTLCIIQSQKIFCSLM